MQASSMTASTDSAMRIPGKRGPKVQEPRKYDVTDPNKVVNCLWCNHPFTPRVRTKNPKYCSAQCNTRQWKYNNPTVTRREYELLQQLKESVGEKLFSDYWRVTLEEVK